MKAIAAFLIIVVLILSACEKDITLDLQGTPPVLVVNGFVTTKPIQNHLLNYNTGFVVKLTTTANYYSLDSFPTVSGATVTITGSDSPSVKHVLTENPLMPGVYLGKPGLVGRAGVTYSLNISSSGQIYTAQDYLDSIPPVKYAQAQLKSNGKYNLTYYSLNEPGNHFYLYKFYRNDTLLNVENKIFVNNGGVGFLAPGGGSNLIDTTISILPIPSPFTYHAGDTAFLEVFSLSQPVYAFYNDLFQQINTDGGFFSSIPANVQSNISSGAVGIFQASMYYTNDTILK